MVLGLIIEQLSKQNYFDYVRDHIYTPAAMHNTDAYSLDEAIPRIATGYTMSLETPGQWKNNTWSNVVKGTPSGGGYSTAKDLLSFALALQQNKLLNAANTNAYTLGRIQYTKGLYGYGFSEETINGHKVIGHTGGHYGIANEFMIIPDLKYIVVILTNGEVENYWETANFIKRQLLGHTPAIDNYFFTRKVCNIISTEGLEKGMTHIKANQNNYKLRESVVERIGYKSLFERKNTAALNLFNLNTVMFPESSTGYYNLAEAFSVVGDLHKTLVYYEKYLALEPTDTEATQKLNRIRSLLKK